jgi:cell division inhibitor SulA/protein ImuA
MSPVAVERAAASGPAAIDAVLNHPAIWRGGECARVAPGVPTGYAELDAQLPGQGWPSGAITEIYADRAGVGEVELVMPAAARLTQAGRWLTLVAPLHVPYAPALAAHGVRLERLLLVQTRGVEENLWACEQALRASCSGAVLLWQDHMHERALRRLQLAAESGSTTLFLFRSARVAPATPAALRLHVSRADGLSVVRILKRRGGGLPPPVILDLHSAFTRRLQRTRLKALSEPLLAPVP